MTTRTGRCLLCLQHFCHWLLHSLTKSDDNPCSRRTSNTQSAVHHEQIILICTLIFHFSSTLLYNKYCTNSILLFITVYAVGPTEHSLEMQPFERNILCIADLYQPASEQYHNVTIVTSNP
jgi:hypothetical protein